AASLGHQRAFAQAGRADAAASALGRGSRRRRRLSPEPQMKSWLTTTDHKRIGLLYFWTAFGFFLIGGTEALIIRAQLVRPAGIGVSAETFNQLFTMHGTTMIFLALMPLSAALFNFIVTILNMRAPGMRMLRLPPFTWMTLVTQFLVITAFPVITVALVLLMFDRFFGTHFFVPSGGGDPILWQHLFWMFGHPEVY